MKKILIAIRNSLIGSLYRQLCRRIFFCFDAERVHDRMVRFRVFLGGNPATKKAVAFSFSYSHPALEQTLPRHSV